MSALVAVSAGAGDDPWRGLMESVAESEHRAKWCAMVEAESDESRRLGAAMAKAAVTLRNYQGPEGCFPAIRTVAAAAAVSPRTVSETIKRLSAIGYLTIFRPSPERRTIGSRSYKIRQSNRYFFHIPEIPVPCRSDGLAWRRSWWQLKALRRVSALAEAKEDSLSTIRQRALFSEDRPAVDLLSARRRAFAQRQLADLAEKRAKQMVMRV